MTAKWIQTRALRYVLVTDDDGVVRGSVEARWGPDTVGGPCEWTARVEYGDDQGAIAEFISVEAARARLEKHLRLTVPG